MPNVFSYSYLKNAELYSIAEFYHLLKRGEYKAAQKKLYLLAKLAEPSDDERRRPRVLPPGTVSLSPSNKHDYSERSKFLLREAVKRCYYDSIFLQVEKRFRKANESLSIQTQQEQQLLKAENEFEEIGNLLNALQLEHYLKEIQKQFFSALDDLIQGEKSNDMTSLIPSDLYLMNLTLLHNYYHNKALLHSKLNPTEHEKTISFYQKAIAIKELFFSCYDKAQKLIIKSFGSSERMISRSDFPPQDNSNHHLTLHSSSTQCLSYFYENYSISEENLLICLLSMGKYHDGLLSVKSIKQLWKKKETMIREKNRPQDLLLP
jgi:hypothetical protein